MLEINPVLKQMMHDFEQLEEVEAILLAGSRTNNTMDQDSDYDVYIYTSKEITPNKRRLITDKYCSYMETNNTFWEIEDDGYLKEGNIPIDIIYRSLKWLDEVLERVVINHQADCGYTTCFWSNLLTSVILFDRNGDAKRIQEKYNIPYPQQLKYNVVSKNRKLLRGKIPAYYYQIEKAITRQDIISINHRISAFLASYFDILFAVNEIPHPGEKKLVKILLERANKLPKDFEVDLKRLIKDISTFDAVILNDLNVLVDSLDELLEEINIDKVLLS